MCNDVAHLAVVRRAVARATNSLGTKGIYGLKFSMLICGKFGSPGLFVPNDARQLSDSVTTG